MPHDMLLDDADKVKAYAWPPGSITEEETREHIPCWSKREKLQHWASILKPMNYYNSMPSMEQHLNRYGPDGVDALRENNTILSAAADDPMFKKMGLTSDTCGEVRKFFHMTTHELHHVVCYCHHGERMEGIHAQERLRVMADRS